MSEMSGLQTALSALYAQRRGLEVVGQNIANANTDGYSRQSVDLQEIGGPSVPAFWARYTGTGSGVQVADITRYRDLFLEIRGALEHGTQGHLDQLKNALGSLETLFGEPSDQGIQEQMTELWSGFDDVANNVDSAASRQQLLQRATTLANTFNTTASNLGTMHQSTLSELNALVDDVNTKAASVAKLNEAIKARKAGGLDANDLMDQRDLMAQDLANKIGATIRSGEDGQIALSVGGTSLVYGASSEKLVVDSTTSTTVIRWQKDNYPASVSSGEAGGDLQILNQTLPQYMSGLDAIAVQLRDQVNALHSAIGGTLDVAASNQSAAGTLSFQMALNGGAAQTVSLTGADWSGAGGAAALQTALQTAIDTAIGAGNATVAVTGGSGSPLSVSLTPTGTNSVTVQASGTNPGFATLLGDTAVGLDGVGGRKFFTGTSAATLAVSSDIGTNANAIAAGAASQGTLDNSVAIKLAEMAQSTTGADSAYRAYIVGLGVDSQTTQQRSSIQQKTTDAVDNQRDSNSSVSNDEEMVNLVQYQRAYEASSRVISVIDSMLNTLINGTGITH
jgi:flagellar hook-associated protein 1 FlgK